MCGEAQSNPAQKWASKPISGLGFDFGPGKNPSRGFFCVVLCRSGPLEGSLQAPEKG